MNREDLLTHFHGGPFDGMTMTVERFVRQLGYEGEWGADRQPPHQISLEITLDNNERRAFAYTVCGNDDLTPDEIHYHFSRTEPQDDGPWLHRG